MLFHIEINLSAFNITWDSRDGVKQKAKAGATACKMQYNVDIVVNQRNFSLPPNDPSYAVYTARHSTFQKRSFAFIDWEKLNRARDECDEMKMRQTAFLDDPSESRLQGLINENIIWVCDCWQISI